MVANSSDERISESAQRGYLGGSRPDVSGGWADAIFGGRQGQLPARLRWWKYNLGEGSWKEALVESYSGVHDFLDSFHYTESGLNHYWGSLGEAAFNTYSGLALFPSTGFVRAANAPYLASIAEGR